MTWLDRINIAMCVLIMAACALWIVILAEDCSDRRAHREQHRMSEP
jgi:hypothetical protein